jgi:hypothetical protein
MPKIEDLLDLANLIDSLPKVNGKAPLLRRLRSQISFFGKYKISKSEEERMVGLILKQFNIEYQELVDKVEFEKKMSEGDS